MAKSLRSKIKRKFRTELRKRVGVPHQVAQEAKIQESLKKAIAAQGTGRSVASLKKLLGASVPVPSSEITGVVSDQMPVDAKETDVSMEDVKKSKKGKKSNKKRKSKFVHFHQLRKKGV